MKLTAHALILTTLAASAVGTLNAQAESFEAIPLCTDAVQNPNTQVGDRCRVDNILYKYSETLYNAGKPDQQKVYYWQNLAKWGGGYIHLPGKKTYEEALLECRKYSNFTLIGVLPGSAEALFALPIFIPNPSTLGAIWALSDSGVYNKEIITYLEPNDGNYFIDTKPMDELASVVCADGY